MIISNGSMKQFNYAARLATIITIANASVAIADIAPSQTDMALPGLDINISTFFKGTFEDNTIDVDGRTYTLSISGDQLTEHYDFDYVTSVNGEVDSVKANLVMTDSETGNSILLAEGILADTVVGENNIENAMNANFNYLFSQEFIASAPAFEEHYGTQMCKPASEASTSAERDAAGVTEHGSIQIGENFQIEFLQLSNGNDIMVANDGRTTCYTGFANITTYEK